MAGSIVQRRTVRNNNYQNDQCPLLPQQAIAVDLDEAIESQYSSDFPAE